MGLPLSSMITRRSDDSGPAVHAPAGPDQATPCPKKRVQGAVRDTTVCFVNDAIKDSLHLIIGQAGGEQSMHVGSDATENHLCWLYGFRPPLRRDLRVDATSTGYLTRTRNIGGPVRKMTELPRFAPRYQARCWAPIITSAMAINTPATIIQRFGINRIVKIVCISPVNCHQWAGAQIITFRQWRHCASVSR